MKIERISENQIRCTLTSFDLSVRNMNLGELAYGSEKARGLFREMIQKASNEVGFDAEDIPLMVEAIPLSNESVMLVITKIEDPEELDTRFSKFSPALEDEDGLFSGLASELLEGADGLGAFLQKDMLGLIADDAVDSTRRTSILSEDGDGDSNSEAPLEKEPAFQTRVYRFQNLDQVTAAAKVTAPLFAGPNTLYKKPETTQYYLVLSNADTDSLVFSRTCNILAEYGDKVRQDAATEAYFKEHYEVIVAKEALQKLALI